MEAFVPRDIQKAEKTVRDSYEPGTVLRLVRDYGALQRGVQVTVAEVAADSVTVDTPEGVRRRASLKYSDRWEVLERHEVNVGIGSVLQLRANDVSADGRKLINGELVTVKAIERDGTICVVGRDRSERRIGVNQRVFQMGYAVTSYGAQGRTVDAVLLADSGVAVASHKKEWYVSVSRARRKIGVFTTNVRKMAARIAASGDRMLGIELVPEARGFTRTATQSLIHQSLRRARNGVAAVQAKINL
jgi:hypothetical protein